MRIAKLKTTPLQTTSQGMLDNYYCVPNNHVFTNDEEDVTSVDSLLTLSLAKKFDYGVFRDSLRDILVTDWQAMMFEDRKKCVQHYRYPPDITNEEWLSYFTEKEHERNWSVLCGKTRACRLTRLFAAFQKISFRLPEAQVGTIYMVTKHMCYDYYYANLPHVIFWISNGTYPPLGIDYTNNGFAAYPGFSVSLMYELLDIFVNGNYENVDNEIILYT